MKSTLIALLLAMMVAGPTAAGLDETAIDRIEIQFSSGHFELAGDLLVPPGQGPHPAIVYVWGSGPTNRAAHIDRSRILRTFLDEGFAVLLYDKPGSGSSTGEFERGHLFEQRADILIDAIDMLKTRDEIAPHAIGIYGSSQASYVMATALARIGSIAFVIAWSCPMENSIEQSAYLVGNYVRCEGGSEQEAAAAEDAYRRRARARTYAEYREAAEYLDGIPAVRDGLGWAGVAPEDAFAPADTTSESFLDPGQVISSLPIPFLALFAENDRQIDPVQGAAAYRRLLKDNDWDSSAVVMIPGADHNMNLSPRGCMQDQKDRYRALGGPTLSPVFVDTVAAWLEKLRPYLERP